MLLLCYCGVDYHSFNLFERGQPVGSSLDLVKSFHKGRFPFVRKTGCSGDKSNGTYFSTGNFSKKKGIPSEAWFNALGKHGIGVYMSK